MKKYPILITIVIVLPLLSFLLIAGITSTLEKHKSEFHKDYKVYSLVLPEKMNFAGEDVPLHIDDVWERFDREMLVNVYWQSSTLLNIKRAARWFPMIEEILRKNGIPDDFKYVAMIESSFLNVVSPSDAHGFWQFIPETAKIYGLEVNDKVDERYHVGKATEAACRYFKDAYKTFGNWTLVAASYNMGIRGVNNQLKSQQVDNFYDLLLNMETSRYIFRILTAKEIYENPQKYGFVVLDQHLYKPYKTYSTVVDTTIDNLVDFALLHNTTYRNLKILNPWLRKQDLPNRGRKQYEVLLPLEVVEVRTGVKTDESSEKDYSPDSLIIHIVQKNQTIDAVALIYQVDAEDVIKWNQLDTEGLKKGQKLNIYLRSEKKDR